MTSGKDSNRVDFHNLGLDLARATEAAALAAGRWMGLGRTQEASLAAATAMHKVLSSVEMDGHIVIGKEPRLGIHTPLDPGQAVGTGTGASMDVVLDPIDGRRLLAQGLPEAVSVIAVAPRGEMWAPAPALYMDKIIVSREVAPFLVPECLDAPAAWTLALVARAKDCEIRDLVVFVLSRGRHDDLVEEIHAAGARTLQPSDGDVSGALMAAEPNGSVDIMMGIGGLPEGVICACAVKALRGAMLGRLAPQSEQERVSIAEAGIDAQKILTCDELVSGEQAFFVATGITAGSVLSAVRYRGPEAVTETIVLRAETGVRRYMRAEHLRTSRRSDPAGPSTNP